MQPVMIVTGASQGIGAAVARLAGRRGWRVALTYRGNRAMAEAVVADIAAAGGQALAIQAAMEDEAAIVDLFRTVDRAFLGLGDDFGPAVMARGVGEQGRDQQRLVLHLAKHGRLRCLGGESAAASAARPGML